MAIVEEELREELTKAGVPEGDQQPLLALAMLGVFMPNASLGVVTRADDFRRAWEATGLPVAKRREIMAKVASKALSHLEKIREKQPWRN